MRQMFLVSVLVISGCVSSVIYAAEPIIAACVNCSEPQRQQLAEQKGMRTPLRNSSISTDVYVVSLPSAAVSRFIVTSVRQWQNGEQVIITTTQAATPDSGINTSIKNAVQFMAQFKDVAGGIDTINLNWGAYQPLISAHQVVTDPGVAIMFQNTIENYINAQTFITSVTAQTIKQLVDLAWVDRVLVHFPDGTTIEIKFDSISDNRSTGEVKLEIEVDVFSAKDNGVPIPTSATAATRLSWGLLGGAQLGRFVDTARAYGIPVAYTGSGSAGMTCSWDGKTLKCRKHH